MKALPTLPPVAGFGQHVLGEALFKDALLRERRRVDRFGRPFLVLVIDHGSTSHAVTTWDPVFEALSAAKRDGDVVGWLELGTVLGLLVPDATAGEASLRLTDRVRRELGARLGGERVNALSIRLHAHGVESWPSGGAIPSVEPLIEGFVHRHRHNPVYDFTKRALDILGSSAALLACLPIFLALFVAVKWTSPGPALFRQTRVGRRGKPFTMLKFRSMRVNAEHGVHKDYVTWFIKKSDKQERNGDEVFKITNDPRVTPVGRFIRKTSLDELPQFWNVLVGEMSLVGPRPPIPFEVEQYQPWHRRRVLDAKPGITGLWQVNGRSRTTFDEMVRLDLRYARIRSLRTDIKILLATPKAVLSGKGAH
ncbi:MAG: sugar transferase [Vicinamibacterales bacterium]